MPEHLDEVCGGIDSFLRKHILGNSRPARCHSPLNQLGAFLVLFGVAVSASRTTRLCAQIVAAVIGASFVIGVQLTAILSYGTPSRVAFLQSETVTRYAPDSESTLWLPARAIRGDMPALMVVS
jgi:hypothetical protein